MRITKTRLKSFGIVVVALTAGCDTGTDPGMDSSIHYHLAVIDPGVGVGSPDDINSLGEVVGSTPLVVEGSSVFNAAWYWRDGRGYLISDSVDLTVEFARAINDRGEIALTARKLAECDGGRGAYRWVPGRTAELVACQIADDIDEKGRVLLADGTIWDEGEVTAVQTPAGIEIDRLRQINAEGDVIGTVWSDECPYPHAAALLDSDWEILGCAVDPRGLNASGDAVFYDSEAREGFLLRDGARINLGDFSPTSLNNSGQVAGERSPNSQPELAIWEAGSFHTVEVDNREMQPSRLGDMNDADQIVASTFGSRGLGVPLLLTPLE